HAGAGDGAYRRRHVGASRARQLRRAFPRRQVIAATAVIQSKESNQSSIVNRQSSMLVLRARWILPIADRPLLNGWIALDRGRVPAIGRAGAALPFREDAPLVDLGQMVILPALANAHTHLELSWLHGRVSPAERFIDWMRAQLRVRSTEPAGAEESI